MSIKADELPPELIFAFLDALEAWSFVEHDHFMIHQFLTRPPTLDAGWEAFTELSPRQQLRSTTEMIDKFVHSAEVRAEWTRLEKRIKGLSRKRNRLVHGKWRKVEVLNGVRTVRIDYFRVYEGRGAGVSRPSTAQEAKAELGKTRFDRNEMRVAEKEFKALAKDLHSLIEPLIKTVGVIRTPR